MSTRRVNLSRIPREKRAEAWERLRTNYPAQADLLQSDFAQAMKKHFPGAVVYIELPMEETK